MKKKITYEENPWPDVNIENLQIIPDFLPKPWELANMARNKKVTITLNEESIEFFKLQAKKHRVSYQAMIRNLLQSYSVRAKE